MPRHIESQLQINCVAWFRLRYSSVADMLFAVGNGGKRNRVEAAIMKAEGVTAGVSDLILLVGRGGYGALCIEMKTTARGSGLSDAQRRWQGNAARYGNRIVTCRTFDEFVTEVSAYMALPANAYPEPNVTYTPKDEHMMLAAEFQRLVKK